MLSIKNLKVQYADQAILNGVNLEIPEGKLHVLMGPNGSGKSTLSAALMGHPTFTVTEGSAEFYGKNLLDLSTTERALRGLFLGFQYPKEIPGVTLSAFLREALNAQGGEAIPLYKFKQLLREELGIVGLPAHFADRDLNHGFSGGEKKRSELLQMRILKPKLAILDEIDSGLDIDALKKLHEILLKIREPGQSLLLITHYPQLLNVVKPDRIHIMVEGRIVDEGGQELSEQIEAEGFDRYRSPSRSLNILS